MPQLDPTWFVSQLFWLLVTFTTLYFILAKIILPPLMETMGLRKTTVESDLDLAQRFKAEAEEARAEYERTLAEARSRSQQLISDALAAQKARADEAGKKMDAQAAAKVAAAEQSIKTRKDELLASLTPAATDLAAQIVEKLTRSAPSSDSVKAAISTAKKEAA